MLLKYEPNEKGLRVQVYNGAVTIAAGEVADVPDAEAKRLLKEFPHNFQAVKPKTQKDLEADVMSAVEKAGDKMVKGGGKKKHGGKKK